MQDGGDLGGDVYSAACEANYHEGAGSPLERVACHEFESKQPPRLAAVAEAR